MSDDSAFTGSERFLEETRDASPANLLIKFECFSLFTKYGIDKYESRAFGAGGYKWKMIIYPEWYESENEECYVSVHFTIAETDSLPVGWEVNAIFAFFVYNHHMNNYLCFRGITRRFNALIPKCGFTKMILKKTLIDPSKGYLVDDSCVFGAEVFVIKSQCVNECLSLVKDDNAPHKREWKISGFSELEGVWHSEEFTVGDHKWKVILHPKGCSLQSKDRYISFFLQCVNAMYFASHRKAKAEVCMSIRIKLNYSLHSKKFNNWFASSTGSRGYDKFISTVDMSSKGFLVDDCCYLEIEMSVQAIVLDAPKIK